MNAAPRWTILLAGFWSVLLIGLGLICVLTPQTVLGGEGFRTIVRGVASACGMLLIALGAQGLLALFKWRIAGLQTVLMVVALWSLLLPTVMMTNLGTVEPLRMLTGLNLFVLSLISQLLFGLPALLAAVQLERVSRELSQ